MKQRRGKYGYIFTAPFVIVFLVFQLYPILYTFYLSLTLDTDSRQTVFAGLRNYQYLLQDKVFLKSIANTWTIWLGCVIPQMISAILLSVLLCQYRIKGASVFRAVFYLPNLVTAASIGILFSVLLDWQTGTVNRILAAAGILSEPYNWLGSPFFARSLTSAIQWWMWFGHSTILLTAGIKVISSDIIEASIVDGANNRQRLFQITLPLIRPTMIYVTVTSLIGGMQIFDIPMTLTGGNGEPQKALMTMILYLYNTAFINRNYAYGAAVSYGIFFIILAVSIVFFKVLTPAEKEEG